jgi:hypothetical protein
MEAGDVLRLEGEWRTLRLIEAQLREVPTLPADILGRIQQRIDQLAKQLRQLEKKPMDWPAELMINASTGLTRGPRCRVDPAAANRWALRLPFELEQYLMRPTPPRLADWREDDVGWGLVLPDRPELTEPQKARADDAPEPIRQLVKDRQAPVFRAVESFNGRKMWRLYNYATQRELPLDATVATGRKEPNAVPYYLLIYAGPAEISWDFQRQLNTCRAVGRLDLVGPELENYVAALLNDWSDARARIDRAVIWSVDLGSGDITRLLRNLLGVRLYSMLLDDNEIGKGVVFLDGEAATGKNLIQHLRSSPEPPGLIVTTSHGRTGPLEEKATMAKNLGIPEDQDGEILDIKDLLNLWKPDGAIWYAHACCSAGVDGESVFTGLLEEGSEADRVVRGVAELGSRVAPLPRALLGCPWPLRAFVGHVEPTFDWTIRDPETGLDLTRALREALYTRLLEPQPVGLALDAWFRRVAALSTGYDNATRAPAEMDTRPARCYHLLASRDVRSTVILGDPAAALPAWPQKSRAAAR